MKVYFRTSNVLKNTLQVFPRIESFHKSNSIERLYQFSIPSHIRTSMFKMNRIPIFHHVNILDWKPFLSYASKNISVFNNGNSFYIKANYEHHRHVSVLMHFLKDKHYAKFVHIDGDFIQDDIPFMDSLMDKFPDLILSFQPSSLEFDYLKVEDIKDDTMYTSTSCILENLELGLTYEQEDKIKYSVVNSKKTGEYFYNGFKRYYKVVDIKKGLITDCALFPNSINTNDIVILQ
jgi:hypothetical protein